MGEFSRLAPLLLYPGAGFSGADFSRAIDEAGEFAPETGEFRVFADGVKPLAPEDHEELYTRTFDINPPCTLEVGWHLFGEQYERGAFLARMRVELKKRGIEEGTELSDHLPTLLRLLDAMEGTEANKFITSSLLPAVRKMREGFEKQTGARENPYLHLVKHIEARLAESAGFPEKTEA